MQRYCTSEAYEARRDIPLAVRVDRIITGKCPCGCGTSLDTLN